MRLAQQIFTFRRFQLKNTAVNGNVTFEPVPSSLGVVSENNNIARFGLLPR